MAVGVAGQSAVVVALGREARTRSPPRACFARYIASSAWPTIASMSGLRLRGRQAEQELFDRGVQRVVAAPARGAARDEGRASRWTTRPDRRR